MLLMKLIFAVIGLFPVQCTTQPDLVVGSVDRSCVWVDCILGVGFDVKILNLVS